MAVAGAAISVLAARPARTCLHQKDSMHEAWICAMNGGDAM
jgi:hypothetical protein